MTALAVSPVGSVQGLEVWSYGTGPEPIVAVHGWSGDHRVFEPLLPWLPPSVRLYSIDLPGCGQSASPREWTMGAVAQPVVDVMHGAGLRGATLVGNCAGAVVALEAARLGAPVRRLVLIDPFAFVPWYFAILTGGGLGRLFYWLTFANPLGRWVGNTALVSKRSDLTDMFRGFATVRHQDTWSFLRLLCTEPRIDRYAELQVPIDVVHGERTFRAVMRSAEMFRTLWPDRCRVYRVAGAGHLPIQEAPRAIAEIGFRGGPHDPDR